VSAGDAVELAELIQSQEIYSLKNPDLKEWCRSMGLPVSGNKQALIDRLIAKVDTKDT
jgi:hypothetical protein